MGKYWLRTLWWFKHIFSDGLGRWKLLFSGINHDDWSQNYSDRWSPLNGGDSKGILPPKMHLTRCLWYLPIDEMITLGHLFNPSKPNIGPDRGQARKYEAKVLRGNLQEDLKTPRHSYHQWQIPDVSRRKQRQPGFFGNSRGLKGMLLTFITP